ncbi:MAG: 16S rRNA (guanine(966)-N(2))-methyltransferase, partial [uncultured Nocardioides sp.]
DAHHRRSRRRAAVDDAARTGDQAHQRPGAGGDVRLRRVLVRAPRRPALPRPLRRLGRCGSRGVVPRRRRRDPRGEGPPYGRADQPQRRRARVRQGRRRRSRCGHGPGEATGGAVRRRLLRPALPAPGHRGAGRPRGPGRARLARARRARRRRALRAGTRAGVARGHRGAAVEAVRRDGALVRSRHL